MSLHMLMFNFGCKILLYIPVDIGLRSSNELPGMKVILSYHLPLQPFGYCLSILAASYQRRMLNQ